MAKIIQQGDIIFVPVDKIPAGAKKVKSKDYHVIARGEATGHSHRVAVKEAELYEFRNIKFLKLMSEVAKVLHEEHKPQILTHPYYKVIRVQEYDYDKERARNIED